MLIQCPECSREISDKAVSCPHCGYPLSAMPAQESFYVVMRDCGSDKIAVLKALRGYFNCNLAYAQSFIKLLPRTVASDLSRDEAESLYKSFSAAGAKMDLCQKDKNTTIAVPDPVRCPCCNSTAIQVVRKNDFSFGKAAMGAALFGPVGSSAGLLGTGKTERVCANCGHRF